MEAITIGDKVVLGAKNCYEHELAVETYAVTTTTKPVQWRLEGCHVGGFVLQQKTMSAIATNARLMGMPPEYAVADLLSPSGGSFPRKWKLHEDQAIRCCNIHMRALVENDNKRSRFAGGSRLLVCPIPNCSVAVWSTAIKSYPATKELRTLRSELFQIIQCLHEQRRLTTRMLTAIEAAPSIGHMNLNEARDLIGLLTGDPPKVETLIAVAKHNVRQITAPKVVREIDLD
jgi:hypothetical protein